jgi:hypothetical protein
LNFPRNATGFSNQVLWFSANGGQTFQASNPAAGQTNRRVGMDEAFSLHLLCRLL